MDGAQPQNARRRLFRSSSNSSDSSLASSWISSYSSADIGIGTSVDPDTTQYSNPEDLERQVRDLESLKQKLIDQKDEKSRILNDIKSGKSNFGPERLEAEKKLLIISLTAQHLLADFKRKCDPKITNLFTMGSVKISGVKLDYSVLNPNISRQYFLCVLISDSKLFASQIAKPDSNGIVDFNIDFVFSNLPIDFEVAIKIYILPVKKTNLKKMGLLCFRKHEDDDEDDFRDSNFTLWKETSIKIGHVNESHEFFLDLVQSRLSKLFVNVSGSIDCVNLTYTGWLDVSRDGLFWNKRWCVLCGTKLKYFGSPMEDMFENPVNVIDLKWCVWVKIPARSECIRNRTLFLETVQGERMETYYLSSDSNQEFGWWRSYLEGVVSTMQIWRRYGCSFS